MHDVNFLNACIWSPEYFVVEINCIIFLTRNKHDEKALSVAEYSIKQILTN